jgi:hypothetical protein
VAVGAVVLLLAQPPKAYRRGPVRPAFGRVVVDDVEDDLDAGCMQQLDHSLEFILDSLGAGFLRSLGGVAGVWCEKSGGVVTPVIGQAQVLQVRLIQVEVHGQQLDGRDAEAFEVLQDGRVRQAGVRPAEFLGHVGVEHALPADMGLINDGVPPRQLQPRVRSPIEVVGHPHARQETVRLVHCTSVGVQQQRLPAVVVNAAGGHGHRQGLPGGCFTEAIPRTVGQVVHHPRWRETS